MGRLAGCAAKEKIVSTKTVTYGPGTATIGGKQYDVQDLKIMITEEAARCSEALACAGLDVSLDSLRTCFIQLSGTMDVAVNSLDEFRSAFTKRKRGSAQWKAERRGFRK